MLVYFPKIIIIDDDPSIIRSLRVNLEADGFDVFTAANGKEALSQIENKLPDLALVDLMLPDIHGFELSKKIKAYLDIPIIMLTAIDTEDTIISGLDLYAEDYIVKPFSYRELLARINRVLKRTQNVRPQGQVIILDENLSIDFARHSLISNGEEKRLTPIESRLLAILVRNANHVVTNERLMDEAWPDGEGDASRMWVNMSRLRDKLESLSASQNHLVTERNIGYKLSIASPNMETAKGLKLSAES